MISALLALTLHAGPLIIAVTPFTGTDVSEDVRKSLTDSLINEFRLLGVKVITEPAYADASITASISHLGGAATKVDLEVTLVADQKVVAARSIQAMGNEELNGVMHVAVQEIVGQLFARLEREPVTQPEAKEPKETVSMSRFSPTGSTVPGLLIALAGAAAVGGGIALFEVAQGNLADVRDGRPSTYPAAEGEAGQSQTFNAVSIIMMTVGGAALAAGCVWAVIAGKSSSSLDFSAFLLPHGTGGFVVGGRF